MGGPSSPGPGPRGGGGGEGIDGFAGMAGVHRPRAVRGLAAAQHLAGIGAWEWDATRDRFHVSQQLQGRWAASLAELLERVVPEDRDKLCAGLESAATGNGREPRETVFRMRSEG